MSKYINTDFIYRYVKEQGKWCKDYSEQLNEWWLTNIWNGQIKPIAGLLLLVRFSLLVAIGCGYFLVFNDQGQEVLRSLADTKGIWRIVWFTVSVIVCAVVAWYWARVSFFFRFYDDTTSTLNISKKRSAPKKGAQKLDSTAPKFTHRFVREHLPRVIGASVFFVIALALYKASLPYGEKYSGPSGQLKLLAAVFFSLGLGFLYLSRSLRRYFKLTDEDRPDDPDFLVHLPQRTLPFLLLTVILTVSLTLLFAYYAIEIAPALGAAAIILLFAAALIANGSFLVLYLGTRRGIPVIGCLVVWAVILSLFVDNHRVRQHAEMRSYGDFESDIGKPVAFQGTTNLASYFDEWIKDLELVYAKHPTIPVFIVAAEGGGIRAAYWTASVLGHLQDQAKLLNLDFSRHVFAISGVSGGSLGAAIFAALVASDAEGTPPNPLNSSDCGNGYNGSINSLRYRSHRILAKDFLSPTVAVMLFPDFFQRFFPISSIDDRAMALERSWEKAWEDCEGKNRFARPFAGLWSGPGLKQVPLLFLNSTVVDSGQRMITSPIPFSQKEFEDVFSDALQTNRVLGHEISLSTAVHSSARFTYVSPAGTIRRLDLINPEEKQRWIRVVDGGYFENSGAVTASELLIELERAAWRRWQLAPKNDKPKPIRPIVIHISNDPLQKEGIRWTQQSSKGAFLAETFSPIEALLNVRPARGNQARTALAYRVLDTDQKVNETRDNTTAISRPGMHLHFRLCEYDTPLPLGWMLSEESQGEMQAQLSKKLAQRLKEYGRERKDRPIAEYHDFVAQRVLIALSGQTYDLPNIQLRSYQDCNDSERFRQEFVRLAKLSERD